MGPRGEDQTRDYHLDIGGGGQCRVSSKTSGLENRGPQINARNTFVAIALAQSLFVH